MGCDIHLHTEIKLDGVWHHYNAPHIRRMYALFSLMANVRNVHLDNKDYIVPISLPKGLPEDLSVITQLSYNRWELDAHNMSWFNAEEIFLLEEWMAKNAPSFVREFDNWGFLFGNDWGGFHSWDRTDYDGYYEYPPEIEDIRFIFWFDN